LSREREQTAAATTTVLRGLRLTGLYLLDTTPQRHSGKARSFFFFVLIHLRNDSRRECRFRCQEKNPG
jgi:hypothetical protein